MRFEVDNMRDGYVDIVRAVVENGESVAPRGQATREVLGATIVLANPQDSLPIGVGRKFGKAIAAAEALQLIGGVSHPELMLRIAPRFANFMDGGTFHGAYGPRLRQQLPRMIERLTSDLDTRQAVVTIWDPLLDLYEDKLTDYPCTNHMHFMVRDGKVDLHVLMRSNDVWWGLAHDVFQFTQLQLTVASVIGLPVGRYFHHANSLHAYERDLEAMEELHDYDGTEVTTPAGLPDPYGFSTGWDRAAKRARALLKGDDPLDPAEAWYSVAIAKAFS